MTDRLRVVACLARKGSLIFMAQRLDGGPDGNRWELPGGKVDAGETDQEALKRELYEELGVDAIVGDFVGDASHGEIELFVYEASWQTDALGRQGQATGWYTFAQIQSMDVPVSDVNVLSSLSPTTEVA